MERTAMRKLITTTMLLLGSATALAAQEPAEKAAPFEVAEAVIATGVVEREPVGVGTEFPATVGTLYFYTIFTGEFDEARVEHVWLHEDKEMARVPLTVRGPRWRTWSSKSILPEWTGRWTVRVEGADGTVLRSTEFTVGVDQ